MSYYLQVLCNESCVYEEDGGPLVIDVGDHVHVGDHKLIVREVRHVLGQPGGKHTVQVICNKFVAKSAAVSAGIRPRVS